MSNNLETTNYGLDRTFLNLSSAVVELPCKAWDLIYFRLFAPINPNRFGQCETREKEIAARTIGATTAILGTVAALTVGAATPWAVGARVLWGAFGMAAWNGVWQLLRSTGIALQKKGYTYVKGEAPEKLLDQENPQVKTMFWNVCGIGGGMPKDHGGVDNWNVRLDGLVQKILAENPDVLVLEEIYDAALGEALISRLKDLFPHLFAHVGPRPIGSTSGLMVFSKYPVHDFSYTLFTENDWAQNRGYTTLEIKATPEATEPVLRIVGTHLSYKPEEAEKRALQISQIINELATKTLKLPTIIGGDLNFKDQEEAATLSKYMKYGYLGTEPTVTQRLMEKWYLKTIDERDEIIDQIAILKQTPEIDDQIAIVECHLNDAFDEKFDTSTALSDHKAVIGTILLKLTKAVNTTLKTVSGSYAAQ